MWLEKQQYCVGMDCVFNSMFFVQRMASMLSMMYNETQSLTLLDLVFAKEEQEAAAAGTGEDFLLPAAKGEESDPE